MLINEQLVQDVKTAWAEDQNHPHRGQEKRELPSFEDFGLLLDTVFQASLYQEEGESIQTSVSWLSRQQFDAEEIPRRRDTPLCLKFDAPIPLEARNLAKLNGVASGRTSSLLAHRENGAPVIWGICFSMGSSGPIGQIPATSNQTRHFRPDCPTATTTGIGSIELTRGDSVIAHIDKGKYLPTQPTVMTSYMLGQYLYALAGVKVDLQNRRFASEGDAEMVASLLKPLELLLDVISQRRIGATVVLLPKASIPQTQAVTSIAWSVSGSLEINSLLAERTRLEQKLRASGDSTGSLMKLKIDLALTHRIRSLVDLAAIDGALLLTPEFEVVSFGTKLRASKWEGHIRPGPVAFEDKSQPLEFSKLGTRHNSAADFVGEIPEAIAFVASADGPIRAIVKHSADKLYYWPDCRVTMFAR